MWSHNQTETSRGHYFTHTRDTSITGAWAPKSVTVLYKMTIKDTWSLFNITIVGCVALSRDKNIPGHKTSQRAVWWCPDIFFASLSFVVRLPDLAVTQREKERAHIHETIHPHSLSVAQCIHSALSPVVICTGYSPLAASLLPSFVGPNETQQL